MKKKATNILLTNIVENGRQEGQDYEDVVKTVTFDEQLMNSC